MKKLFIIIFIVASTNVCNAQSFGATTIVNKNDQPVSELQSKRGLMKLLQEQSFDTLSSKENECASFNQSGLFTLFDSALGGWVVLWKTGMILVKNKDGYAGIYLLQNGDTDYHLYPEGYIFKSSCDAKMFILEFCKKQDLKQIKWNQ